MTVKQISIFLENKPGRLADLTEFLAKNDINLRALSLAEAADFGIVRIIVDDVYSASTVLKDADYVINITKVIAVTVPDVPGGLSRVIRIFGDSGINVEYMYGFTSQKEGMANMIFRVQDNQKAVEALTKAGIRPACQEDLEKM